MPNNGWVKHPYPLKMGSQGRLTVPLEVRTSMGLSLGSKVYIALITQKKHEAKKKE